MAGTSFLSTADVTDINQAKQDAWETRLALNGQTCTILSPVNVINPLTGISPAYAPGASVDCIVANTRTQPDDREISGALRAAGMREIWLPTGTTVTDDDRIADEAGQEYSIVGPVTGPTTPTNPSFAVAVSLVV